MTTSNGTSLPLAQVLATRPVILDGGLSTELERAGNDLSGDLWSAVLLRDAPEAIVAAHRAFFEAGAEIATTASYQASFEGFAAHGIDRREATQLLQRSVLLAREAAEEARRTGRSWVAASVGPFGATLATGEEYTGAYVEPHWPGRPGGGLGVAELREFHRPRLEVLAAAGADVLACETLPATAEVEALIAEVQALAVPAWISLTTVTGGDGQVRTRRGEDAATAFALARGVDEIIAVGVNCTDPLGVAAAVRVAGEASGKPVVVYPNSGESWDAMARSWLGEPDFTDQDVADWLASGARLVGGCCRVGPEQVAAITRAVAASASPVEGRA
ncbi:MAG TPA: homocysteine S-methyltransferase [Kineosporiaceae bacterium]|nr:homocysteine S-methyltransferase [Kineosporiaceae bacterium]